MTKVEDTQRLSEIAAALREAAADGAACDAWLRMLFLDSGIALWPTRPQMAGYRTKPLRPGSVR